MNKSTQQLVAECDVSGATLTEIEGPGKSGGAYGGEGEAGERAGGRDPGGGEEEGQFVCDDRRGRPGRGDVIRLACDSVHPWGSCVCSRIAVTRAGDVAVR